MKIWIDLSNSPHPLLFAPVARRLEELGHEVAVTARDNAQTIELARRWWPDVEVIGGPSPKARHRKAMAMAGRVRQLASWARAQRPDVALSHNSYGQIVAARLTRIPAVTAMDFEHQPANHLAFRLSRTVLLPAALRDSPEVVKQGARGAKVRFYDGLKEEIYLGDFEPDESVLDEVGVSRSPGRVLVVARTPPSRAVYHRMGNPIFVEALRSVGSDPKVDTVVLTRHPEQREELSLLGLERLRLPSHAVEARSLLSYADLVIGAGGTMTREAALLGVPTFSLFAGERPAVDRWLEDRGELRRLERVEDLLPVTARDGHRNGLADLRTRGEALIDLVARETVAAAR
jgi:uncharacterized protein